MTLLRLAPKKSLTLRQTRQEPVGAMPKVSGSGAGVATTLTREAQLMVASTGEQAEEGASGAPMKGVVRPGVATTSQAEAAQLEPSSALVAASLAGWMEENAPEASMANMVRPGAAATSQAKTTQPTILVCRGL